MQERCAQSWLCSPGAANSAAPMLDHINATSIPVFAAVFAATFCVHMSGPMSLLHFPLSLHTFCLLQCNLPADHVCLLPYDVYKHAQDEPCGEAPKVPCIYSKGFNSESEWYKLSDADWLCASMHVCVRVWCRLCLYASLIYDVHICV